ncbi:hypothetical protein I317_02251 [Kwoniella heveanensis CBS 569]|uniref:ubiquitinyl hydrolase 1 n=1 Tax=Kwoniella heveanensis BCC8398 TaxID=1296120 RepID=A0A1B9GW30_9TREE|nr:hypothetical protein I316_03276 [Kwoniella heveanensis BCC8398]OCF43809.1 hypothetical protein I317_02251 [Kwoniella heveanensis CBS 569]
MSRLRRAFGTPKAGGNGTPDPKPSPSANTVIANPWEANDVGPSIGTNKSKEQGELLFGLENFGNTCYCNSVMQALYACDAFRRFVETYPDVKPPLTALGPPAGDGDLPLSPSLGGPGTGGNGPLSPTFSKANPFESPSTNNVGNGLGRDAVTPMSPGGKEKRGWTSLGRRSTNNGGSVPTLGALQAQAAASAQSPPKPTSPTIEEPKMFYRPPEPDPNQPPPSVFQTIQTLFFHLTHSPPHQPAAPKPNKDANGANAQTASLLPDTAAAPNPANPAAPTVNPLTPGAPQGPPLLASLPPPSAPRSGGPWQAGKLGRGVVRPEDLLRVVKRENEMFKGMSQQDAHEFLGWLLNQVAEEIELVDKHLKAQGKSVTEGKLPGKTFVQSLFEGTLTNETRCLSCETTSERDEAFLDLSIDIEQHTSVTACLRQFSASEMLCQKNKFYCDSCCGLQEAEKRMKIKRLPNVLALHLKRFKYQEATGRYGKLFYRVPFPTQLRLPNTTDDMDDPDRLYELFSVVVHIGNGPHHGHYVTLVRSAGRWLMCDDENIEPINDDDLFRYFGDYPSGAGYVLFYQAVDLDLASLGLKLPTPPPEPQVDGVPRDLASVTRQGDTQLIDLSEGTTSSSKAPLKVNIPPSPETPVKVLPPQTGRAPAPAASVPPVKRQTTVSPSPTVRPNGSAPSQAVDRQFGFDTSSAASTPSESTPASVAPSIGGASSKANKDKDGGKWLSRVTGKDKADKRSSLIANGASTPASTSTSAPQTVPAAAASEPRSTSSRPSTSQTTSTTFSGLGVNVPSTMHGQGAEGVQGVRTPPPSDQTTPTPANGSGVRNGSAANTGNGFTPATMSSSVMSSVSAASASTGTSSVPPPSSLSASVPSVSVPAPGAAAGSAPSTTPAQPIPSSQLSPPTQSNPASSISSSVSSSAIGLSLGRKPSTSGRDRTVSGSSTGSGYAGGGSLGRRLSGMGGKLGRSGSMAFGKIGFGKKEKEKEGIKEEQRREDERRTR